MIRYTSAVVILVVTRNNKVFIELEETRWGRD
jgi:hypothetical protein